MRQNLIIVALVIWMVCNVAAVCVSHNSFQINEIERIALRYPDDFRAQLNASELFLRTGDAPRGLSYASRAIKIHDDRVSALINAATAADSLRAWPTSYRCYKRTFSLFPDKRVANNLMYVCLALGLKEEYFLLQAANPMLIDGLDIEETTL